MTSSKTDVAFISLMQPDTRASKSGGGSGNLTIGFLMMCVSFICYVEDDK